MLRHDGAHVIPELVLLKTICKFVKWGIKHTVFGITPIQMHEIKFYLTFNVCFFKTINLPFRLLLYKYIWFKLVKDPILDGIVPAFV